MLTLIITIVIVALVLSLICAMAEASGGYMGDSSMVPGILCFFGTILAVVIVLGCLFGKISIHIN